MPFKTKFKNPRKTTRKKPVYKVANWTEYNKSLKKRGTLTLYLPYGDLKSHFINEETYVAGVAGQQPTYSDAYIELIYTFYRLFGWGLRQITGYFDDLWQIKKLEIPTPSFGHLSDLFAHLPVSVRQCCNKVAKRLENGEPVTLIMDSTGFRFGKAISWYETKYNKPCVQRPWRKFHLSMDQDMNMYDVAITETEVSDRAIMNHFLTLKDPDLNIEKVLADGAYYSIDGVQRMAEQGIIPAIPPPSNAVVHGRQDTTWHDTVVQYIKDKGSVYAFHKTVGYGLRALVEAQISRIKRCMGSSLKTQRLESQEREGKIIANILNQWNTFGKCICVKAA
jgi:hypothetical protein